MSANCSLTDRNNATVNIWRQEIPKDDLNYIRELLQSKRISPNKILRNCGCSLFHLIAGHSNEQFALKVVELFLLYKGNPNLSSDDGLTPLHVAAIWNKKLILKLLLHHNANPLIEDIDGKSVYEYAFEEKNDDILKELEVFTLEQSRTAANSSSDYRYQAANDYSITDDSSSESEANSEINSLLTLDLDESKTSSSPSCDSFKTAVEEFEYKDDTFQIQLIEKRFLPSSRSCSETSSGLVTPIEDCTILGNKVTLELLSKRLEQLSFSLDFQNLQSDKCIIVREKKIYSVELEKTLTDPKWFKELLLSQKDYELAVIKQFNNKNYQESQRVTRNQWKDQWQKSSFTYLLLDPRITKNLPNTREQICDEVIWANFLEAIFYIGKGQRARPYAHLYEAFIEWKKNQLNSMPKIKCLNKKIDRILNIWSENYGVVCLHVFQNVLQNEAFAREAAMIDAIGLKHLTNLRRGQYYGIAANWPNKQKKLWGISLLFKSLQIFLHEGEKQLKPYDVSCD